MAGLSGRRTRSARRANPTARGLRWSEKKESSPYPEDRGDAQ
jgi:hypothetical protein